MIYALIPAAGKSERMGRPKLALPLGGSTVLEVVIATLRRARLERILVVVGPHVPQLTGLVTAAGAEYLLLGYETPSMRETILEGVEEVEDCYRPCLEDQLLLVPGDHPALDAAVVGELLRARSSNPHFSIVLPTFHGRRGHPVLIDWKHVCAFRETPPATGLNAYLRHHADETLEMPVDTAGVVRDLDTPEDYERLLQDWQPTE